MKRFSALLLLLMLMAFPALADKECWYENKYGTHDFEQTNVVLPTCTTEGYYDIECRQCGYNERHTTSGATGHSWELVASESLVPSCEEDGFNLFVCENCGQIQTRIVSRYGHSWKDEGIIKAPTCQTEGVARSRCSRCNLTTDRDLPAADHSYGDWFVSTEPTDCTAGQRTRVCSVCGATDSASFDPDGTLRRGAKGEDVRALQQMLIDLGLLNDKADGVFGAKTEAAVGAFQEAAALTRDGVAWPQTLSQLTLQWKSVMTPEAPVVDAPPVVDTPPETPAPPAFCRFVLDENGAEHAQYCAYHQSAIDIARSLQSAADEAHALTVQNQIRLLWQTELEGLYSEWLENTPVEEQGAVIAVRASFTSYLTVLETALGPQYGDETAVIRQINALLERQCVTLCNMLHGEQ